MRLTVLIVPRDHGELAAERLWAAGATALEEREDGSTIELRTVLAQDDRISSARIGPLPAGWDLRFVDVDPAPSERWRDFASPVRINERLTIRPAWLDAVREDGVLEVAIEPAGSFGLGDHATTKLAADATDRLVRDGDRVLDVGCGTGLLGIIAARRGAGRVVAVDTSEAAREATLDNARRNGVHPVLDVSTMPVGELDGVFDVVLANILAPVLVAIADDLIRLTSADGHLVISGVLAERWGHVADALSPMGVVSSSRMGEWAVAVLSHRPAGRPHPAARSAR